MVDAERRARAVRNVMIVLAFVAIDAALIALSVLLVLFSDRTALSLLVGGGAATALLVGPLVLGSLWAFWDRGDSPDGPELFRRVAIVVAIVSVLGAGILVVLGALGRLNAWLVFGIIGVSALLLLASRPYGRALRRRESSLRRDSRGPDEGADAYDGASLRITALTFSIALVVVAVAVTAAAVLTSADPGEVADLLLAVASFPLLAAMGSTIIRALPIGRGVRDAFGGDAGRARRVGRAVLRSRGEPLDEKDRLAATIWVRRFLRYQRYVLAWLTLLYSALMLQQLAGVVRGGGFAGVSVVTFVFLAVVVIVVVPVLLRQRRRARAWADANPLPGPDQPIPQ